MGVSFIPKRFALLKSISVTFILFAFIIRAILYGLSFSYIDFSIWNLVKVFAIGLVYDIGVLSYIWALVSVYLLIFPYKYYGSRVDKIILYFTYVVLLLILVFSFLAEIPFWEEYQRRFNFIAIDYLLYTYEVVANINQTYPVPIVILVILIITAVTFWITKRKAVFISAFENENRFLSRLAVFSVSFCVLAIYHFNINNKDAETFGNLSENELAKSGIYSFFAAFQANELDYEAFYDTLTTKQALSRVRQLVVAPNDSLFSSSSSIKRYVRNQGTELRPNVIFIGMESMSAAFLERYGSEKNLTPAIDSILKESISFTNMYATGTRTIRGLEAISLAIPPTPGRSIVKRLNNEDLFTIGEVFKQKGYSRTFFTGGDGNFDNMANYFGNNGFDIVDRRRDLALYDELPVKRIQIKDDQVTFENAWGACDGDIYNVVLDKANKDYQSGKPFFYMFMTNSNHPPYTYPDSIIDIPSGKRSGALRYADKTFEEFIKNAKGQPWFENTVFVSCADHCAYSAGRTEINVKSHHIPGFIFNLKNQEPMEVDKLCSQIDIFPTLFGYLRWSYTSKLFGQDVNQTTEERALIGNHRKVCLLKKDRLMVLDTQKEHQFYAWDKEKNTLQVVDTDTTFLQDAVSYYQSAYEFFKHGQLKVEAE